MAKNPVDDRPRRAVGRSDTDLRRRRLTSIVFVLVVAVGLALSALIERSLQLRQQETAWRLADQQAHRLQERMATAFSATYALAAVIRQNKGQIDDFDELAYQLIASFSGISNLQLAPGGVVRQVVPKAGNSEVIGHDVLNDPASSRGARLAMETRKLVLAGPLELLQGGQGIIGRMPVFVADGSGKDAFWGFATVVVRLTDLLNSAGMATIEQQGHHYQLSSQHPETGERRVFAGASGAALASPVVSEFSVPNGRWQLAVAPADGWHSPLRIGLELAVVLLVGVLVARHYAGLLDRQGAAGAGR